MVPHDQDRDQINPRSLVLSGRQQDLYDLISKQGYVPDDRNFSDFCESLKSGRPWLISGTRGSGKTAFPEAVASACNLTMCIVAGRDGLKQEEILYEWDREEQDNWMRENLLIAKGLPEVERDNFLADARRAKWKRDFLILGEVGCAYDLAGCSEVPPILLLDESDKFGPAIEDSLLMPLERGLVYIPRFESGYIGVTDWLSRPIVITTSNDLRHKLSSPFVSRHIYSRFETPSLIKELEILAARNPEASTAQLALGIKLLDAVRGVAGLEDYPSIRESIDVVGAFIRDGIERIDEESLLRFFCYFAKAWEAQELLKLQIDYLLLMAEVYQPDVDTWLESRDQLWAKQWRIDEIESKYEVADKANTLRYAWCKSAKH